MINQRSGALARMPNPVRRHSLSMQLVLWNTLMLALLLGALGAIIRYAVRSTILASVDSQLVTQTQPGGWPPPPFRGRHDDHGLGHGFGRPNDGHEPGPAQTGFDHTKDMNGPGFFGPPGGPPRRNSAFERTRPRLYGLDGKPYFTEDTYKILDPRTYALSKQRQTVYSTVTMNGEPARVLSRPILQHGVVLAVTQGFYNLSDIYRDLEQLDRVLLTQIPVGLICAAIAGSTLTVRVLRRVRHMTQAAARIGSEDFSERIPVLGRDEFAELAETFNGLLGRLHSALDQQRRFTADASHELKSPLTIIRGNAGIALRSRSLDPGCHDAIAEIDHAAETMSVLVQDLLMLARSDAGRLGQHPIDILAHEIVARARNSVRRDNMAPIRLCIADESLSIRGNEDELARLFANLLNNAQQHTPPDGNITVTVSRHRDEAVMTVEDTGSGIAPEHLPHLGERFYRVDSARARVDGGTGLGLSICKSIVDAHHGGLRIDSEVGRGTTVTIALPLSP